MSMTLSLSARRAWIEISIENTHNFAETASLSARRAWIEIRSGLHPLIASLVALRKESVDRNSKTFKKVLTSTCRSPQGERG